MDASLAAERPSRSRDRKSTRLNSSHDQISYAVFCLKKKKNTSELQSRSDLVCRLLLEKKKRLCSLRPRPQHVDRGRETHVNTVCHLRSLLTALSLCT